MSENVARQSLTPIEEARAYAIYFDINPDVASTKFSGLPRMAGIKGYSEKISVAIETVKKRIPLLWLIPEVQTMLENEELTIGSKNKISIK